MINLTQEMKMYDFCDKISCKVQNNGSEVIWSYHKRKFFLFKVLEN